VKTCTSHRVLVINDGKSDTFVKASDRFRIANFHNHYRIRPGQYAEFVLLDRVWYVAA